MNRATLRPCVRSIFSVLFPFTISAVLFSVVAQTGVHLESASNAKPDEERTGEVEAVDIESLRTQVNYVLGDGGLLVETAFDKIAYRNSMAYPDSEGEGFINVAPWQPKSVEQIALGERSLNETCRVDSTTTAAYLLGIEPSLDSENKAHFRMLKERTY